MYACVCLYLHRRRHCSSTLSSRATSSLIFPQVSTAPAAATAATEISPGIFWMAAETGQNFLQYDEDMES